MINDFDKKIGGEENPKKEQTIKNKNENTKRKNNFFEFQSKKGSRLKNKVLHILKFRRLNQRDERKKTEIWESSKIS